MKERPSPQALNQAQSIIDANARLIDPDANNPFRKNVLFETVKETGLKAIEILDRDKPMKFIQEGKEYIVFENPLGETRITALRGGEV